jgi:hypothetical protein
MIIDTDTVWADAMLLLPAPMNSIKAKAMLLAIGLQESRMTYRKQHHDGPARGLWQFERGGGVRGVLMHKATTVIAHAVCAAREVAPTSLTVWEALEHDDVLACCFARLLLYTVPHGLPGPDQWQEGWAQYLWAWRPGKPHQETWPGFYARAWQAA